MARTHEYNVKMIWTGNKGTGTSNYRDYERSYTISINNKTDISGSSDPAFRGDSQKHNPEEMLVMALSSCHMLSYLHLCATSGIVVTDYTDEAHGAMQEDAEKGGFFTSVVLKPRVTITDASKKELANSLHEKAHHGCFIANSVNFPVTAEPTIDISA